MNRASFLRTDLWSLLPGGIALISAIGVLYYISTRNYLLFHSIIEFFSIVVAFGISVTAWNARDQLKTSFLPFLGIAYFFVASLDFVHALGYAGMGVFPGSTPNLPTQLWIAARSMEALSLFAAAFLIDRRIRYGPVIATYFVWSLLLIAAIFYLKIFPACYIEGVGLTPFKKTAEFVISALLLITADLVYNRRDRFEKDIFILFIASVIFTVFSEIAFVYYVSVYGFSNMVGHIFKLVSFYLIYRAIIQKGIREPYELIFRDLKKSEESLTRLNEQLEARVTERTADLRRSNEALRRENQARLRTAQTLKDREETIRTITSSAQDAVLMMDNDGKITFWNPAAELMFGYSSKEALGAELHGLLMPARFLDEFRGAFPHFRETGEGPVVGNTLELSALRKDRAEFPIELSLSTVMLKGKWNAIGIIRDITGRKRAENQITHLNRVLRSVRNIDQLIVKERDKNTLLETACKILAQVTDYRMVWIGLIEQGHKRIMPVSHAGFESGYLKIAAMTWDDEPTGKGTAGTAIKTRKPYVINDIATSPDYAMWKKEAERRGYRSSVSAPLVVGDTLYGALSVYSDRAMFSDEAEVTLLAELAQDIAFSLSSIDSDEEKRRIQEELRINEEKYHRIVDTAMEGIWVLDEQLTIVFANPQMARMLGYGIDEIVGKRVDSFLFSEDIAEQAARMKDRRKGVSARYERRFVRKDGTTLWTIVSPTAIMDAGNRFCGSFAMFTDITEIKNSVEAQSRIAAIVASSDDAIIGKTLDGIITSWNSGAEKIYGYTAEEVIGKPITILESGDNPSEIPALIERIRNGEAVDHYETVRRRKDNQQVDISLSISPIRNGAGAIVGAATIARNITEHKRSEEALRAAVIYNRTLIEASIDPLVTIGQDGTITDVNAATEAATGYTRGELIGTDFSDYFTDPGSARAGYRQVFDRGAVRDYPLDIRHRDGRITPVLYNATVYRDTAGKVVGVLAAARDITERRRMEQQLLQTEKLSSLGGILSGVAHELNNPLTSIIGNAQLLSREDLPDDIVSKVNIIIKESRRSAKIVQGLLAFARKHKPERRNVDINDVIREAYQLREYELKVDNVMMRFNPSSDVLSTSADPHQLLQVFINIINNAHDALITVGGGSLLISSSRRNDTIIIEFRDDGPGISKDIIKYIFDPFFTTKDVGKGTGLGLSISYGIVNEHGGRIEAESEPGKGATFTIELPVIHEGPTKKKAERISIAHPGGKKSVLVVEDEDSIRSLLVEELTRRGITVFDTPSGETALDMIMRERFDLIISDVKMPGIGGKDIYTFVRRDFPHLADRIVFITGDVLSRDTQIFLETSGNRYIEKPFEISEVTDIIAELLTDESGIDETEG
jgi:PAS domain S-box-containing protein